MKGLSGTLLTIFGWELTGDFPDIDKSVIIFAPHTSNWDYIIGKLYLNEKGVVNNSLVKKELFFFPLNMFMKALGSIPIDRKKRSNVVSQLATVFEEKEKINLIISAEGTRKKEKHWKRGFYNIARTANVPIVISYIDYEKRKVGIKGIVNDTSNLRTTMTEINTIYKNIRGKYPEKFILDERYI